MDYDSRSALIVVDVQNDFADPTGSLYVSAGEAIVPLVNAEVIKATSRDALVVYTKDSHPEHTPHFAKDGGIWPEHCVAGTWGAEFHPQLLIAGKTILKGTNGEDGYSGFTMRDPETGEASSTEMGALLEARQIERVVVVGLALDYCVKATALDSAALGLATFVPLELTAAVNLSPRDGDEAAAELRRAGIG